MTTDNTSPYEIHDDRFRHLVVGNARHGLIKWAREAK